MNLFDRTSRTVARACVLLVALAGCVAGASGGPTTDPADAAETGAADAAETGAADVVMNSAEFTVQASLARWLPRPGSRSDGYLLADVVVENTASAAPVRLSPALFSLETSQALSYGTTTGLQFEMQCGSSVSVARGGRASCRVAFEVPLRETPVRIVYSDGPGRTASAALGAVRPFAEACAQGVALASATAPCACAAERCGSSFMSARSLLSSMCGSIWQCRNDVPRYCADTGACPVGCNNSLVEEYLWCFAAECPSGCGG